MISINKTLLLAFLKITRYISKCVAVLLLLVMGETFYCSAACAIGTDNCCRTETEDDDCCKSKKDCCDKEEPAGVPENNCQKDHLEFFKTVGKYFGDNGAVSVCFFQTTSIIILTENTWNLPETSFTLFSSNGFHPPPPNDEVTLLTHNFRI